MNRFNLKTFGSTSKGVCHVVEIYDKKIMLDCGINPKKFLEELKDVDFGVLVCEHSDHAKHLKDFLKYRIRFYMSQGTKKALKIKDNYAYQLSVPRTKVISPTLPPMLLTIIPVNHDAKEPTAFIISYKDVIIAYLVDLKLSNEYLELEKFKPTHIIIECNYIDSIIEQNVNKGKINPSLYKRITKYHSSLEDTKIFFKELQRYSPNLEQIYLTHISEVNGDPDTMKEEIQKLTGVEVYVV